MSREPQKLEWSTDPPDSEGDWLVSNEIGKILVLSVVQDGVWINDDSWIERDGFLTEFGYEARYARIAGPEE